MRLKDSVQGLFLIVLGCIVWKSAQGASVFLCFMGVMMLLHDIEKAIYKACLTFVRYYRRRML